MMRGRGEAVQGEEASGMKIKWGLVNDQWVYVIGFTAYCGLAGAMGGNEWIGLCSFPFWYGFALLGASLD